MIWYIRHVVMIITTKNMFFSFFFFFLFSLSLSCPLLLPAMSPFANLGHHADTTIGIPRGLAAELFRGGAVQQLTVISPLSVGLRLTHSRFPSSSTIQIEGSWDHLWNCPTGWVVKVKKTSQNIFRTTELHLPIPKKRHFIRKEPILGFPVDFLVVRFNVCIDTCNTILVPPTVFQEFTF